MFLPQFSPWKLSAFVHNKSSSNNGNQERVILHQEANQELHLALINGLNCQKRDISFSQPVPYPTVANICKSIIACQGLVGLRKNKDRELI
jgi:hypothetical protein